MEKEKIDHVFLEKIIKNFSFEITKKICVAVSGGLDSMVLINLLLEIPNIDLVVAHCNFTLRNKESDEDEIFIKNFCIKKNIICHIKRFDTLSFSKKNKLSIQMAARKLRYDWFTELLKIYSYEYIVLGHHLNDTIETFFINIFRGTGIKGLLGIPKKNKKFIRPLYNFTKKEILHYATIKNIKWRLDSSNKEIKYLRNKIRFFLSKFSYFSSSFDKGVQKTINYLHDENFLIEKEIDKKYRKITVEKKENPFFWKIECKEIEKLNPLSFYLFKLFSPYGFYDINGLKHLINAQSGKLLLSKKYRIIKNRNDWIVISNHFYLVNKNKIYIIQNIENRDFLPIDIKFFLDPKKETKKKMFFIDFDKIKFPLLLRTWRKGDFFVPFNMKGTKKLSKYYKEKKFSLLEKEQIWLLINGNGYIIFIIGNRLDDRFKVTEKTKKILGIKI
ncbi:tRNA lysidine(34) synthetase TilS [Blattabacterium cuenoti]|uniref:tRNA lysidine(34) synthetase TilS n=1 Tax=Blattabacterium cuenoti TaxID=1653831 RepID=UPI00163D1F13|nr:tRNA lysidine(34) synthetase TilS [Blattabacterium cuenoti]